MRSLQRVSERHELGQVADRLASIRGCFASDLSVLEGQLGTLDVGARRRNARSAALATNAAHHLLGQPGMRIRPLCVLLGARLSGISIDDDIRRVALAAELIHAATLLHDDVIDEAPERRGAPAARTVYGNSASILAGDLLLIEALERVQRGVVHSAAASRARGRAALLDALLDTIAHMVAAEAAQLEQRGRFAPDRAAALDIVEGKTASLFSWALSAAAQLAGRPDDEIMALRRAGRSLGIAFQWVDDVLDFDGDRAATGKALFGDLAQGKLTWPLIIACERDETLVGDLERLAQHSLTGEAIQHAAMAQRIATRICDLGAAEQARADATAQHASAIAAIETLPERAGSELAKEQIAVIAEAMLARRH